MTYQNIAVGSKTEAQRRGRWSCEHEEYDDHTNNPQMVQDESEISELNLNNIQKHHSICPKEEMKSNLAKPQKGENELRNPCLDF